MKKFCVLIAPKAAQDIRAAFDYLRSENPIYATQWRIGLQHAISGLSTLPHKNAVAPESAEFDVEIRTLIYGRGTPWRIFYTVDDEQVSVLHIRHGKQDYWQPSASEIPDD